LELPSLFEFYSKAAIVFLGSFFFILVFIMRKNHPNSLFIPTFGYLLFIFSSCAYVPLMVYLSNQKAVITKILFGSRSKI